MMAAKGRVPSDRDRKKVESYLSLWGNKAEAIPLVYQDYGYEAEWCHVSAKHRALTEGGKRVHGWALWRFRDLIVAEHHSVWENPDGKLEDVTPPRYDSNRILFVRDDTATIVEQGDTYALYANRTSDARIPYIDKGLPYDHINLLLPKQKPDFLNYCKRLEIEPSSIVTDDERG